MYQLYFANQCVLTEGLDSGFGAFLCDGEAVVEAAGRAVRRAEVPCVELRYTMGTEGEVRAPISPDTEAQWLRSMCHIFCI